MCGRYRIELSWSEIHAALDKFLTPPAQPALNVEARVQVRPTQHVPIVIGGDSGPVVRNARWWLVPWFHKGKLKDWKATTFNARAETVASSRT